MGGIKMMLFFKNKLNEVFAFETIEQKEKFKPELVQISEQEKNELTAPTRSKVNAVRKAEIMARFSAIDAESVRPLRAIAAGNASEFDKSKLNELEKERAALIEELKAL